MANPTSQDTPPLDGNRGIQNAQARFEERSRERLTSEQLRRKGTSLRGTMSQVARQRQELETILRDDPALISQYENDTAGLLLENRPIAPRFPFIMIIFATLKDIVDAADFTIFGMIITTSLSFMLSIILFFWLMARSSGGWWKKRIIRKLWARYAVMLFIEMVPFIKIVPATIILVLMTHYSETKVVRAFNAALEKMRMGKIGNL